MPRILMLFFLPIAALSLACCGGGSPHATDGLTDEPQTATPPESAKLPAELQTATPIEPVQSGYFSVSAESVERIEIRYYSFLSDDSPRRVIGVDDPPTVKELCTLLAGLPVRGDLFKKMAPSVSYTHLLFYAGDDNVGEAHIYNGSLQMSDTAFLAAPNPDEKRIVERVTALNP